MNLLNEDVLKLLNCLMSMCAKIVHTQLWVLVYTSSSLNAWVGRDKELFNLHVPTLALKAGYLATCSVFWQSWKRFARAGNGISSSRLAVERETITCTCKYL